MRPQSSAPPSSPFLLYFHLHSVLLFFGFLCVSSQTNETLIPSAANDTDRWRLFEPNGANTEDLRAYRRFLEQTLANVSEMIDREEIENKHFPVGVPISSSLPDPDSAFVRSRLSAIPTNETETIEEPKIFGVRTLQLERQTVQPFEPTTNHTAEECKRLTQSELVAELKQKGTYNPDLMAWDVSGVFRFLDRSTLDQYERHAKSQRSNKQAVQRNVEALERILTELNLHCDVRTPEVLSKLTNLTVPEPRRSIISPSLRMNDDEVRFKRHTMADDLLRSFDQSFLRDEPTTEEIKKQNVIGDVHVVPFGCDKRGEEEDGYLRLCGACQAIRKLPETFFPPFINEVLCDEDKACLYFYDYPHGKCKQKHMNFVVLRNVGTPECQIWQKFNLNVRVSCECFVDEMSFFSKYV